jgi:predicted nucleotidyltransferase
VTFLPHDFIETREGLVFAVVGSAIEQGRVLCFLRYAPGQTSPFKVSTGEANELLRSHHPQYLYYSPALDAHLHGVPLTDIYRHHRPRRRLREVLTAVERDPLENVLVGLLEKFAAAGLPPDSLGVTGSLLLGVQKAGSDIDLVVYGRKPFSIARRIIERLTGRGELDALDAALWRDAYDRRACSLDFEAFMWHEKRKWNKGAIAGTKFDITLVNETSPVASPRYRKIEKAVVRARVIDDRRGFDYPACYRLDDETIAEAACFTHTYTGQAFTGETVEIAGMIEESASGSRRIVVGSSREAPGEYIKVLTEASG